MNIFCAGAGALGSNLVANLITQRQSPRITVLDFDKIERRNIQAGTQFYLPDQIGMSKVEALQYNLYKWFNKKIEIYDIKLTLKNCPITSSFDLIIDTFDNYDGRRLTQEIGKMYKIDLLHLGFSQLMTFEIAWDENYEVPSDNVSEIDICEMSGARSFIQLVAGLGGMVVQEYIKNNKKLNFVGNSYNVRKIV